MGIWSDIDDDEDDLIERYNNPEDYLEFEDEEENDENENDDEQ